MFDKLLGLFRYRGEIPKSILLRASTMASHTNCYIAFDKDGTCHMFPVKPLLLRNSGVWISRGRMGVFQSEEVRFTKYKYQYSNWDLLIEPQPEAVIPFIYERFTPTYTISRKSQI